MITFAHAQQNQETTLPMRALQDDSPPPARFASDPAWVPQSLQLPRLSLPRLPIASESLTAPF